MPGRSYQSSVDGYRYGFNGKEDDKGISGGAQDYGMRIYDKRLGRFFSVDPLTPKYADLTPYQFGSNRPIDGVDLDGKEWSWSAKMVKGKDNKPKLVITLNVKIQYDIDNLVNAPVNLIGTAKDYIKNKFNKEYTTTSGMAVEIETVAEFVQVHNSAVSKGGILMVFSEQTPVDPFIPPDATGRTKEIGNTQDNRIDIWRNTQLETVDDFEMIRTILHELGHTLGLEHPFLSGDNSNNFMNYGAVGTQDNVILNQLLNGLIEIMKDVKNATIPTNIPNMGAAGNSFNVNTPTTSGSEDLGTGTYQNARFLD